jgi:hypothetical protein
VKAPFTWPKISDSISSRGIAAQLMATNGPLARALSVWIALAQSSLPVPLSPVMNTVALEVAALSMMRYTACICGDDPISPAKDGRATSLR